MKKVAMCLCRALALTLVSNLSLAESIIPCGWGVMNLHEKNEELVGFSTKQQPDYDNPNYTNAHPYAVAFIFKSGPAHLVYYSPSGQVLGGDWEVLESEHWARKNIESVESLYHQCRGSNLEKKPNKRF